MHNDKQLWQKKTTSNNLVPNWLRSNKNPKQFHDILYEVSEYSEQLFTKVLQNNDLLFHGESCCFILTGSKFSSLQNKSAD